MTDTRTTEQAAKTEQKLVVQLTVVIVQLERRLIDTQELLERALRKLGERQARLRDLARGKLPAKRRAVRVWGLGKAYLAG